MSNFWKGEHKEFFTIKIFKLLSFIGGKLHKNDFLQSQHIHGCLNNQKILKIKFLWKVFCYKFNEERYFTVLLLLLLLLSFIVSKFFSRNLEMLIIYASFEEKYCKVLDLINSSLSINANVIPKYFPFNTRPIHLYIIRSLTCQLNLQ